MQYDAVARQIRTSKRSIALGSVKPDDERTYFVIRAKDTPWEAGTLRIIRAVPGDTMPIPATGTVIRLHNRETGLYLGYYTVVSIAQGDALYGHRIPLWDLCATDDVRPVRGEKSPSGKADSAPSAPVVTPAVMPALVPARNVSTRERVSHFAPKAQPEVQPEAAQQDKRVPAGARK